MAYRELSMIEEREVLRRYTLSEGLRAISRGTGLDRKTAEAAATRSASKGKYWLWVHGFRTSFQTRSIGLNSGL